MARIDPLCGLSVDDFAGLALDLLPQGYAWPREPDTVLYRYWLAVAEEQRRLHDRGCQLLEVESFPCSSVELLPDWERVFGLPDECTPAGLSLAERQIALCLKIAMRGRQDPAFFVEIAALVGFEVEIIERFPDRVGLARAGCATVADCPYWWTVRVLHQTVSYAKAGCSVAGLGLCIPPNIDLLRCVIRRAAPAHTIVTFEFPED